MRTPQKNPQILKLAELMQIVSDLRTNGFRPVKQQRLHTTQQLRTAITSFLRYRRLTRMALFINLMFVTLVTGTLLLSTGWYTIALCIICFLGFLGFLGQSAIQRSAFREAIGREERGENAIQLLALPFYFLAYPQLERAMRGELTTVFRELGLVPADR